MLALVKISKSSNEKADRKHSGERNAEKAHQARLRPSRVEYRRHTFTTASWGRVLNR
jgi:hypothetical protein